MKNNVLLLLLLAKIQDGHYSTSSFEVLSFSNVLIGHSTNLIKVAFNSRIERLVYTHFNFLGLQGSVKIVAVRSSTSLTALPLSD